SGSDGNAPIDHSRAKPGAGTSLPPPSSAVAEEARTSSIFCAASSAARVVRPAASVEDTPSAKSWASDRSAVASSPEATSVSASETTRQDDARGLPARKPRKSAVRHDKSRGQLQFLLPRGSMNRSDFESRYRYQLAGTPALRASSWMPVIAFELSLISWLTRSSSASAFFRSCSMTERCAGSERAAKSVVSALMRLWSASAKLFDRSSESRACLRRSFQYASSFF